MTSQHRWSALEEFATAPWADEAIVSCYLGKVFHFMSSRYAGWQVKANRFPADSFLPTLVAAKAAVERSRTQGSQWRIDELPALVACGPSHAVVVTEINSTEPLRTFKRPDRPLMTLFDI